MQHNGRKSAKGNHNNPLTVINSLTQRLASTTDHIAVLRIRVTVCVRLEKEKRQERWKATCCTIAHIASCVAYTCMTAVVSQSNNSPSSSHWFSHGTRVQAHILTELNTTLFTVGITSSLRLISSLGLMHLYWLEWRSKGCCVQVWQWLHQWPCKKMWGNSISLLICQ